MILLPFILAMTVSKGASLQSAINAAKPYTEIRIEPGLYEEKLFVDKPGIHLKGTGPGVILSWHDSAGTAGGTGKSGSVTVTADDFHAEDLTIENTFSRNRPLEREGHQAVALKVTGDRAHFKRVRFLGFQDTLYATTANGKVARQYFDDCYIEGNVDFIFGDSMATFRNCEIHSLAHQVVYITAQSKVRPNQESGYVFDHCRLTAEANTKVYLGRPWRAYANVVFLNTWMCQEIIAEGWHEWEHDGKPSLPTAFYAEYHSKGPGANPSRRQLTKAEYKRIQRGRV